MNSQDIAIIGMSCRLPGANNIRKFWETILSGKCNISDFSEIIPENSKNPKKIYSKGLLQGVSNFDNTFFGITHKEAGLIDPQQRFLMTCAWEAFEDAGYDVTRLNKRASVYASINMDTYLDFRNPITDSAAEKLHLRILNDSNFAATRLAHILNLHGEAISVGSGCSSSLVAVHLACQSLLNGMSEMALVASSSIIFAEDFGYKYSE
jgi:polyketide synthase PksJ